MIYGEPCKIARWHRESRKDSSALISSITEFLDICPITKKDICFEKAFEYEIIPPDSEISQRIKEEAKLRRPGMYKES